MGMRRGADCTENSLFAYSLVWLPDVIHFRCFTKDWRRQGKVVFKNYRAWLLWSKLPFKFQCRVEREKYATCREIENLIIFFNSTSSYDFCGFLRLTGVLEWRV